MKIPSSAEELTILLTNRFAISVEETLILEMTYKLEEWEFALCMLRYVRVNQAKSQSNQSHKGKTQAAI